MEVGNLPNSELLANLRRLVAESKQLDAVMLEQLAEVDARRLYLDEGFPSMFAYCVEALHFSEGAAYNRITAARAGREYPGVLDAVRKGDVHITGVRLLAPHLTSQNHVELLEAAKHKTKREIEMLIVERLLKPEPRSLVQRAPSGRADLHPVSVPSTEMVRSVPGPASSESLGSGRFRVHFTLSPEGYTRLMELRALMRHSVPDGDVAHIFERALELLQREVRRKKLAETSGTSRTPAVTGTTRHIPAAIKRAVVERDGLQCTFESAAGRRCGSREFLEFHHLEPWAREQKHTVEGISLRCRAHNQHAARQDFGEAWMDRFGRQSGKGGTRSGTS